MQTQQVTGANNDDLYDGSSELVYDTKMENATTEALNREAEQALATGDVDKAIFYSIRSLAIDGNQHELYATIGYIHFRKGNNTLASKAFERALAIDPAHIPSLSGLGRSHLNQKDYSQAKALLEKAAWIDQKRFEPQVYMNNENQTAASDDSDALETSQSPEETAEKTVALAQISEPLPNEADAMGLTPKSEQQRTLEAQLKAMAPSWQVDQQSPFAVYNSLGVIADLERQFELAQFYYSLAIEIQPRNPSPYNNLGYSYYLSEDWSKAENVYHKLLNIDANYTQAWRNLGLLYTRQGKYNQALDAFSRLMSDPEAYNTVGYLCMLAKKHADAELFFEKAIDLSPVYYELARENLKQNRQYLEQAMVTKP